MPVNFKKLCSNLLPKAQYKAIVTDMKFAAGGSKAILVTLTIAEGEYAKRVHTETIPEKARSFKLMPLLNACHVDVNREFETEEELCKFGFESAKGKTVLIDMDVRTYNGTEYNNVGNFYPLADSTVQAEDVALSFGEKPEVKGNSLDGIVEEETSIPTEPMNAAPAEEAEPNLNVNLEDVDDNPF